MQIMLQERFTAAVDARLAELGWSRSELARQMGAPRSYVSTYLSGRVSPGLEVVERFGVALQIDPAELLANPESVTV